MSTAVARSPGADPVKPAVLGMLLFITSEIMFFGGLFALYLSLRAAASEWPPSGVESSLTLPLIGTGVLFASSAVVHLAVKSLEKGDPRRGLRLLVATAALGGLFLGIQGIEYAQAGFGLGDHAYGTAFFTLTGFHGLHVALGVAMLLIAALQVGRGTASSQGQALATSLYWHFVDAVWVLVLVAVYLID
jgi:cytochrome c oxidase subunit 3